MATTNGRVRGIETDGGFAFLGIPYAADPFGPRRFGPPAPPDPWDGERDATAYGATVPKNGYPPPIDGLLPEPQIAGNDCLNCNVWTPDPGRSGLPVLVWIHGGAFTYGSGAVADYAGDTFARDGVVTVTCNYRLGVDGFSWLEGAPPNRGLLDQVAALHWVRENIAAFGGDPDQVTVAGESAGAMSVVSLMAMPSARGLFRRAIAQSGAGHHASTEATARRIGAYLADSLGVAPTAVAVAELPMERLLVAQADLAAGPLQTPDADRWGEVTRNQMVFEPVIDGEILPGLPFDVVAAGRGSDVDLLIGTNRDEQRLFIVPTGAFDLIDDTMVELGSAIWDTPPGALERYRANWPGGPPGAVLCDVATDWFFRIPAIRLAESAGRGTRPTYAYEFGWRSALFDGRLGACHALEIPFVFDHVARVEGPNLLGAPGAGTVVTALQPLADVMHRAWVDFVTTGDPGWDPYEPERRATMSFATTSEVVEDPRGDERALWEGRR